MKPRVREVRWLLFEDDELKELKTGLQWLKEADENTTEGDMLLEEIKHEQENRQQGPDGVWYLRG